MPRAFIQGITVSTCKKLILCEVVRDMGNGGWWEEWLVHVRSLCCLLQEVGLMMSGNYIAMTQDIHFARVYYKGYGNKKWKVLNVWIVSDCCRNH